MPKLAEKVNYLENLIEKIAYEHLKTEESIFRLSEEMKDFKDEMKDFKEEMKDFKDEMRLFKSQSDENQKKMDKKWGDLANKLGTVVEDIVAPNIPMIAKKYFQCENILRFLVNAEVKKTTDKITLKEFDSILITDSIVILTEVKLSARSENAKEFVQFIKNNEFFKYFPELNEKKLIPIYASMKVNENITAYLTKNEIYVMGMCQGTMDLLNFNEIKN